MGKYDKFRKLIIPLSVAKSERTVSLPGVTGRVVVTGIGNEGIDIGEWFEERLESEDITINVTNITNLTELITLTGLPEGSDDLGTFTGTIISDNTTIKNALQQLETYIESLVSGGNGIYGGSGTVPTSVIATLTDNITFTTDNASGYFLANIGDLTGSFILVNGTSAKLQFYDLASTNKVEVESGGINLSTITPDRVTISGLDARYAANYAASYSNRSLVDKEYVDGLLASGLPSGSTGSILIHNGTNYISASPITETQTGITGTSVTLASTPLNYARFNLFKNGQYLVISDDYTRSGTTITLTAAIALVATDKITAQYYI